MKADNTQLAKDMSVNGVCDRVPVLQHIGAVHTLSVDTYPSLLNGILVVLPGVGSKLLRIHVQNGLSEPSLRMNSHSEANLLAMRFMLVDVRNHISLSISNLIVRFVA